jgi:indolepyruvate ferredoxin oxidoreductase
VRAAEAPLGSTRLGEAVASYYFKLLAYKDEYEVARLYSDPAFWSAMDSRFDGDFTVNFHLAPTFLARPDPASGRIRKLVFGPWMKTAFGWLSKLRRLRGTPFDVFGYHPERKAERALIRQYEADITLLLDGLSPQTLALAVEIASLPEEIRGYGHIKAGLIAKAVEKREALLARWLQQHDEGNLSCGSRG